MNQPQALGPKLSPSLLPLPLGWHHGHACNFGSHVSQWQTVEQVQGMLSSLSFSSSSNPHGLRPLPSCSQPRDEATAPSLVHYLLLLRLQSASAAINVGRTLASSSTPFSSSEQPQSLAHEPLDSSPPPLPFAPTLSPYLHLLLRRAAVEHIFFFFVFRPAPATPRPRLHLVSFASTLALFSTHSRPLPLPATPFSSSSPRFPLFLLPPRCLNPPPGNRPRLLSSGLLRPNSLQQP